MTCKACESRQRNPISGLYQADCLDCCTALVISARPNKQQAAALMAALTRMPRTPGRAQILASVARCLEKQPLAGQRCTQPLAVD